MKRSVQSVLRRPVTAAILSAYGIHDSVKRRLHESGATEGEDRHGFKSEGPIRLTKITDAQNRVEIGTLPVGIAGLNANTWQSNLDFRSLPDHLIDYYQRAGTRGEYRDLAGAEAVWGTIPHPIRMAGPDALESFREGRDWSHIVPRSLGGSDSASNGIFEISSINRARGAEVMTEAHLEAAQLDAVGFAIANAITLTAEVMIKVALVSVAVESVFATMEEGLRYYDGEISKAELHSRICKRLCKRAALAVVIAGLLTGLAIVFPLFATVLSALAIPMAAAGILMLSVRFCSLGAAWLQRMGPEPAISACRLARDGSNNAWQGVKRVSNKTWHGANGYSNRALEWVG